ncbi:MAG: diaminopimelate epimerase [Deltaproteobacteria bacterium]|nr:diaminopimelate epimerase [Deltaproteobacteria bacterium]
MLEPWSFLKAHGLGNDFVLHLASAGEPPPSAAAVRALCDRRQGLGADGVILLFPRPEPGIYRMLLLNADGSEAEISGNGLRCAVGALVVWWCRVAGGEPVIETGAGRRRGRVLAAAPGPTATRPGGDALPLQVEVEVSMGRPSFAASAIPLAGVALSPTGLIHLEVDGSEVEGMALSLGNPHLVIAGPLPDEEEVLRLGPLLERHPGFPSRINVIWMSLPREGRSELRIWERGCGSTRACGSGACAAAAVAQRRGWASPGELLRLSMAGGEARVRLPAGVEDELLLSGAVRLVAQGECYL